MKMLACYDVSDDTRREHLARILLDYGQRVQESVFWLDADEELLERMERRVLPAIDASTDSLWLVRICEACTPKLRAFGVQRMPDVPAFFIV